MSKDSRPVILVQASGVRTSPHRDDRKEGSTVFHISSYLHWRLITGLPLHQLAMPIPFFRPSFAPPAVFKDEPLPWIKANPLSKLFFHWITPILKVGYSRPLEPDGKLYHVRTMYTEPS